MIKRIFRLAAALLMSLPLLQAKGDEGSENLKVMSYNIRLGSGKDGTNSWALRYTATEEMLKDQKPDVFGVQEALDYQVHYIEDMCGYESVGVGREDGKKEGEHMSIFWNKKTVSMLKWGTFWLSETPQKPSKGWDAACFRTATWALMKDKKTGKKFYFVNTHLDHEGKEAQKNGLKLIVEKIAEMNPEGLPMVLTGDFNIEPSNPALADLDARMQSTRKIAEKTDDLTTYNGWGKSSMMIDYIYVSGFSSCPEYQTVTKRYADRKFISDHYPICATLIF
jgi:endonuclease/exonuclease/phosphatase family metal-dependent hydrolase